MKKIILVLLTFFFTSSVYADHYKKKIDIKNFNPKSHCSPKKSLLIPAAKVFPGGELIKLNSYFSKSNNLFSFSKALTSS